MMMMIQKARYIGNVIIIFFNYIKKGYPLLALYFMFSCIKQIVGYKKYSIITYTFKNDITLSFPNNHLTLLVISEIFLFEVFRKLQGCECVLDIGGYIGESAVYLSKINKQVIVFEPDTEAYQILKNNIKGHKNITGYNKFVTVTGEDLYISKTENIDCGAKGSHDQKGVKTSAISIKQVIEEHNADGIKIDIEGGEFEILEYMINKNIFTFKKGCIEFHFYEEIHERKKFFTSFCNTLENLGYTYEIFDNYDNKIHKSAVQNKTLFLCNMYFEKGKLA